MDSGAYIMMKAWQGQLCGSRPSTNLISRFKDTHLDATASEFYPCGETIGARADDDCVELIHLSFGPQISSRLGVELEYIFPFRKNRWGLFIEPTYQAFQDEIVWNDEKVNTRYQSIELTAGCRHYVFIHEKAALFFTLAYLFEHEINNSAVFYEKSTFWNIRIDPESSFELGTGVKLFGKFSVEARYNRVKDAAPLVNSDLTFNSITFILGYTIL